MSTRPSSKPVHPQILLRTKSLHTDTADSATCQHINLCSTPWTYFAVIATLSMLSSIKPCSVVGISIHISVRPRSIEKILSKHSCQQGGSSILQAWLLTFVFGSIDHCHHPRSTLDILLIFAFENTTGFPNVFPLSLFHSILHATLVDIPMRIILRFLAFISGVDHLSFSMRQSLFITCPFPNLSTLRYHSRSHKSLFMTGDGSVSSAMRNC